MAIPLYRKMMFVNVNNVYKKIESAYVNINSSWKEIVDIWVNIDGVWKQLILTPYTFSQVDSLGYTFNNIDNLNISWEDANMGGW